MSLDEKRFENRVKDVVVDRSKYLMLHGSSTPAVLDYVMLFTPRSGSSWLTTILSGLLGDPDEYLNEAFVRDISQSLQTTDKFEYIDLLRRLKKSENGVFGIQVRDIDIELFDRSLFFYFFGRARYFLVWRRNLVSQAISLYKAVETGRFHSFSAGDMNVPPPEQVEVDRVFHWMHHIALIEHANYAILKSRELPFEQLIYEDVTGRKDLAIRIVADHLGVPVPRALEAQFRSEAHKIGDTWNTEAETFIRNEYPDVVRKFEDERFIRF